MTHWPPGDGEMAERVRTHDWPSTPLGAIIGWPTSLKVATRLLLNTRHPMFIYWGPELIQLYNDAYRDTMGPEKHPSALGGHGRQTWLESWGTIGPQIAQVMGGGPATWHENQLVPVTRHGSQQAVWWTYSFSPIEDEAAPNGVGGVLVICRDVTQEHLAREALAASEARQKFLLALSDALRPLGDPVAIQEAAMRVLGAAMMVNRAFYGDVELDHDTLVIGPGYTDGASPLEGHVKFSEFELDMVAWFRAGRTYVIEDTQRDARFGERAKAGFAAIGVGAAVGVPLVKEGRVRAIVSLHQDRPRRWTAAEIALLEETAERTWAAVERARSETGLRESEEQQRLTLQLVPAMLWWADAAGNDIFSNDRWKFYTGQGEAETQDYGWLDAIHPDDVAETHAVFAQAFATGGPIERQQRIRQAGDGYRWHLVRHVPVRDGAGEIRRWFGAAIDVHVLRELQDRQGVLVAELQHRTRNLIAVVRGLARDTMGQASSMESFRTAFDDRLSALSRVQGLLSRSDAEPITIGALLRLELDALGAKIAGDRVIVEGPKVFLRPSTVQTLALALHELATNARKYGALSHDGGRLAVTWRKRSETGERRLIIEWVETGLERAPERLHGEDVSGGYGRELIEHALPHALGARTSYALSASGVRCTIDLAVRSGKGEP